ncbi:hypothetical protein [Paraliomyxa miuraensis]|uniref:hypothetical protein n=1 Tax=Paraliomyxa miuraensis TaxID=376150 RepID=UPI002255B3A0|nr:hypothetical protein [Paraliomyxa miuraensis]MCX4244214.1 hypothetical protein [Paraliomyxa miuraensis]
MNKRRRWGLIGLMSLGGGLLAVGALSSGGSGNGGSGGSGSGSGSGGSSGGSGSGSGSGSGGSGGSDDGGSDTGGGSSTGDDPFGDLPPPPPPDDPFGDLPPPPPPDDDDPDPEPWQPGKHIGGGKGGGGTTPTPKPTQPGTTDGPMPPIDTPEDDDPVLPEPDDEFDPPWSELLDPYPRGGTFYPVVENDRFGGTNSTYSIAYRYLLSEAYLAASEVGGLDHEDASAWALAIAKQDKLRLRIIDLIQCSGWNDAMYGANPVTVSHASKNGRSILLRPVHGPTAERIEDRFAPFRNITMAGNPADGSYRDYELLWMPPIDREVLWESAGQVLTTTGMEWDDGSSMENPPPWVMWLGIDDLSGALVGDFGCPGSDGELEVE